MESGSESQGEPDGNTKTSGKTRKTQPIQAYRYCFTLKKSDDESQKSQLFYTLKEIAKEFVFQEELSDTGYKHYQGCFSLARKERLQAVKNLIGFHDIHLEL